MKPFDIPTLEDDRVYVPFTLKVKGKKPLEFRVPRMDFIPPEDVKVMTWLLAELEQKPELVEGDEPGRFEKAGVLIMLQPYVTEDQYKALDELPLGSLKAVRDHWQAQSRVTLGEA